MRLRLGGSFLALCIGGLIVAAPAWAQTVEGAVNEVGEDYLVVDGTRFSVGPDTRVRLLPGQEASEFRVEPNVPAEAVGDESRPWVTYTPAAFDDVGRARVTGTGREAESIRLLPYGSGGERNE